MPNINDMKESKFLKQGDCDPAILVTITNVYQENVAKKNDAPEMKWCLKFKEQEKPFVLNGTNAKIIGAFLGEETDDWVGRKIVLYRDPNITYGDKLVGGIRARAPKPRPVAEGKFASQQQRPQQPSRRPVPPPPPQDDAPEYDGGDYEDNPDADTPY